MCFGPDQSTGVAGKVRQVSEVSLPTMYQSNAMLNACMQSLVCLCLEQVVEVVQSLPDLPDSHAALEVPGHLQPSVDGLERRERLRSHQLHVRRCTGAPSKLYQTSPQKDRSKALSDGSMSSHTCRTPHGPGSHNVLLLRSGAQHMQKRLCSREARRCAPQHGVSSCAGLRDRAEAPCAPLRRRPCVYVPRFQHRMTGVASLHLSSPRSPAKQRVRSFPQIEQCNNALAVVPDMLTGPRGYHPRALCFQRVVS